MGALEPSRECSRLARFWAAWRDSGRFLAGDDFWGHPPRLWALGAPSSCFNIRCRPVARVGQSRPTDASGGGARRGRPHNGGAPLATFWQHFFYPTASDRAPLVPLPRTIGAQ